MPLCLGAVGVGPAEQEAEVGVVGARGPDLLAVDDEAVAVEHGPGAERREVAARARLAHAEAGRLLAVQDRAWRTARSAPGCRSRGSTGRRCRGPAALVGAGDAGLGELLDVDERLDRPGVASAALGRPARARASRRRTSCGSSAGPRPAAWPVETGRVGGHLLVGSGGSRPATRATPRGTPPPSRRSGASCGDLLGGPARACGPARARWAAALPSSGSPGLGPLHQEVEVVLPGEADAAVELEAVADDQALAVARRRLGHATPPRAGGRRPRRW